MIEDLEGASSEPPRRRHVLAASLATTGGAALLFLTLVLLPFEVSGPPGTILPAPSASPAPLVTIASGPGILTNIEQARCQYGAGQQWIVLSVSPLHVGTPVEAPGGRPPSIVLAVPPTSGRTIPTRMVVDQTTMWMNVTCTTSDLAAPRLDLRSIAR